MINAAYFHSFTLSYNNLFRNVTKEHCLLCKRQTKHDDASWQTAGTIRRLPA